MLERLSENSNRRKSKNGPLSGTPVDISSLPSGNKVILHSRITKQKKSDESETVSSADGLPTTKGKNKLAQEERKDEEEENEKRTSTKGRKEHLQREKSKENVNRSENKSGNQRTKANKNNRNKEEPVHEQDRVERCEEEHEKRGKGIPDEANNSEMPNEQVSDEERRPEQKVSNFD